MSTKHKVIIVAFVVLVSLLLLIYFFGGKTTEKFEDEDGDYQDDFANDDDDEDSPKKEAKVAEPKSKGTKPKKEKFADDKKAKKTEEEDDESSAPASKKIDILKESMNYLNSMNLPFAIKKDAFTQLFNEKGFSMLEKFSTIEDIKEYVSNVVAKVTGKATPTPKSNESKKETPEKLKTVPERTPV